MWLKRVEGDGNSAWEAWWIDEINYLGKIDHFGRLLCCVLSLRHALVAWALIYYLDISHVQLSVCGAMFMLSLLSFALLRYRVAYR